MRIALVGDWFLPRLGGIELQVRDLALQLQRRGHEVEVITAVPGPGVVDGLTVHRLGVPRIPGAGIVFTPSAFRVIRELLVAGRYDAVHVHFGIIAPVAYGATAIAQSLGLPVVATFHSVLTHFGFALRVLRAALGVAHWRVHWTAVSSVVATAARPLTGEARVEVVPNGIDAAYWAEGRPAHRPARGAIRAVSVMRLHRRKRPRALVEATRRALRALPARALQLEIIGDGAERGPLQRIVARHGMGNSVTLRGPLSRALVRAALHQADVLVLPSRLEAFGIAALEARCAGVPVVAMAASGAADFLRPSVDSLLVDDDNALAAALVSLASDPGLLSRLREGSAAPPPAASDWASVASLLEQLYASVPAAAGQSPTRLSAAGNAMIGEVALPLAGAGRPME